jgi:hypothetical protein
MAVALLPIACSAFVIRRTKSVRHNGESIFVSQRRSSGLKTGSRWVHANTLRLPAILTIRSTFCNQRAPECIHCAQPFQIREYFTVPGLVDEAGFLQDDRAVAASHQRIRVVITLYSSCIARETVRSPGDADIAHINCRTNDGRSRLSFNLAKCRSRVDVKFQLTAR